MRFIVIFLLLSNSLVFGQIIGPSLQVRLINHDGERTKHYVKGHHNGKLIDVPIVNGYAPLISTQYINGIEVRTFDYSKKYPWQSTTVWKDQSIVEIPTISTIDETKKTSIFEAKEGAFYNFEETDIYLKKFSEIK